MVLKEKTEIPSGKNIVELATNAVNGIMREKLCGRNDGSNRDRSAVVRDLPLVGPEVLERRRAIRFLEFGDLEASEDVESTPDMSQFFQDGVQAVFQDVPLRNLVAVDVAEQEPRCSISYVLPQKCREFAT